MISYFTSPLGCADKIIRIFNTSGKLLRSIKDSRDVVRALCKVPASNPTGAQFASASNDGVIRLFTLQGDVVAELYGHESFIYSLDSLPSGELVSAGEDRTVRVWKGAQCIQTITHPAISVWSVAACKANGDIVTGASDRIVRVFSRDPERKATLEVVQQFQSAVKESAIPAQQIGKVNKEKLPGPDFLQNRSGTKDGQVVMIREDDGSVTAHMWSTATNSWTSVGTVVDSAASGGKKTEYLGQDYDYVFDVDIEDGKPPLKLPYNVSQNPYDVATRFIHENELPISYLEQVAHFITQNAQGATIGQEATTSNEATVPETRPKVLPQKTYLSIKSANLKVISKKLQELNEKLISSGSKDVSLSPSDVDTVLSLCSQLEAGQLKDSRVVEDGVSLLFKVATSWPPSNRLPGLDLLRVLAAATPVIAQTDYGGGNIVTGIIASGVFGSPINVNNAMLAIRTIANLFETEAGRDLAVHEFNHIIPEIGSALASAGTSANRNLTIASTTLYINYAVFLTSDTTRAFSAESSEKALPLLEQVNKILSVDKDSEAVYRGLVALGTLILGLGEEVKTTAKDIYDVRGILRKISAADIGKEPRIKGVVTEIQEALA